MSYRAPHFRSDGFDRVSCEGVPMPDGVGLVDAWVDGFAPWHRPGRCPVVHRGWGNRCATRNSRGWWDNPHDAPGVLWDPR